MTSTTTDQINGGLPVLPEGLRWSVYRDSYRVLNIALQRERRILGFIFWKTLYDEPITRWSDSLYEKNQTAEEIRQSTIKVANEIAVRYNKMRAHDEAKQEVEQLFKEAL